MKQFLSILSAFLLLVTCIQAQSITKEINNALDKFNSTLPDEKVYIHLDKPAYTSGDMIWLKAYLLNGNNLGNSKQSEIVYIDLINPKEVVVKSLTLYTTSGFVEGDIFLNHNLKEGLYKIRAYTNWIKNFGEKTFFEKEIFINNTTSETVIISTPTISNKISLSFFPEGGDMISGTSQKIAFKSVNANGKGTDIEGVILNQDGKEVNKFSSYHLGMGSFNLIVENGQRYNAKITKPEGIDSVYALPRVISGPSLNIIAQDPHAIKLKVYTPTSQSLVVTAQIRGKIYYSTSLTAQTGTSEIIVPLDSFPVGIAQFTLFDSKKIPHSERLVFVNSKKMVNIQITTDKEQYLPREKVNMKIKANDENGKPVSGNFSLSVSNDKLYSLIDDKQDNILSWLLVSSELKGKVEEPNFYFNENNTKAKEALDLLMLTHGWRRFSWKEILNAKPEETLSTFSYKPERRTIAGRLIFDLSYEKKPIGNKKIKVDGTNQFTRTDQQGYFEFNNLDLDAKNIVLKAKHGLHKDTIHVNNYSLKYIKNVEENSTYTPLGLIYTNQPDTITLTIIDKHYISSNNNFSSTIQTSQQEAFARYCKDRLMQLKTFGLPEMIVNYEPLSYLTFRCGISSIKINSNTIQDPSGNIIEVSQGRIAGMDIIRNSGEAGTTPNVAIRGNRSITSANSPLYIVDGVQYNNIQDINPNDILSMEVIKDGTTAMYGARGANGVVIVTTKRGFNSYTGFNSEPSLKIIQEDVQSDNSIYNARTFYTPIYEPGVTDSISNDYRETIFWKPIIETDSKGEAEVSFYNSNEETNFRAIIEGVSFTGNPGRKEYTYSIQTK